MEVIPLKRLSLPKAKAHALNIKRARTFPGPETYARENPGCIPRVHRIVFVISPLPLLLLPSLNTCHHAGVSCSRPSCAVHHCVTVI